MNPATKFLKFLTIIFLISWLATSNFLSGFFLNKRLGVEKPSNREFTIAIIDVGFDLQQFRGSKLLTPFNAHDYSSIVTEIGQYDKQGILSFSNHGGSMLEIFIGPYGFLRNSKIIPIQIFSYMDLPNALNHAIDRGAEIISISLAFAPKQAPLPRVAFDALLNASRFMPIFIAAGNESLILENSNYGRSIIQLAQLSDSRIWLIGASRFSLFGEVRAPFSNYCLSENGKKIFFYAPGEGIVMGDVLQKFLSAGISGTSIATPLAVARILLFADKFNISIDEAILSIKKINYLRQF